MNQTAFAAPSSIMDDDLETSSRPARPAAGPIRSARVWLATLVVAASIGQAAFAQRDLKSIPDSDPELERRTLKVADGFEINLFAADPMLAKPIQMNWDSAGRLWVACSSTYPQIKPGHKPDDKIVVLEDVDGDGRADKSTVFADGLLIPTAVIPGDGGAYVANSTELLFMTDLDGDGKADRTTVVLSGFGTEDTHHILHTLRWGPGGSLYFNQSVYIHSHVETPWGPRSLPGGGVWRYRTESGRLEVFTRGMVNPWGHVFDRWGQSLLTDGAYGEGINHGFPGATFFWATGAKRILTGLSPGQPKHCGLEVLSGRGLPPESSGVFVTNDFRGNRVNRFSLTPEGSSFVARQLPDLITSSNVAFRPVDVKMGPDGAIYIADWYNPIIQHGEVDFRDPRRDHVHGRIWRVSAKNRPTVPRPQLVGAPIPALLDALKLPEDWTREKAKLELKRRGASLVEPMLAEWVARLDGKDAEYEHHRLEALWSYQTIDVVEATLLKAVLESKNDRARAAAVRVLSAWSERLPQTLQLLAAAVRDASPLVRLEGVNGLRALETVEAVETALIALDRPVDANLDFALWLTAQQLQSVWLPAFEANKAMFGGNFRRILFALKASESPAALRPLLRMVQQGRVPPAELPGVLELVAAQAGPEELATTLDLTLAAPPAQRGVFLAALEKAARDRKSRPANDVARLLPWLNEGPDEDRAAVARLAGYWKLAGTRGEMAIWADDENVGLPRRLAAVEALAHLGDAADKLVLIRLAGNARPTGVRIHAIVALSSLDLTTAAAHAVALLGQNISEGDAAAMFDAFLRQKAGPQELVRALDGKMLSAAVAEAAVRYVGSTGRDMAPLLSALRKAGGLTAMQVQMSVDERRLLLAEIAAKGDAHRGEEVFRRDSIQCLRCHGIAGAGGLVGPDLISIGASAQVDYLVESILEPSKKIKEGYHTVTVAKEDGAIVSGVLIAKNDRVLRLRDGNGNELTIPTAAIAAQKQSPISLMPADLAKSLRRGEFVDLVRFLSELGKEGPFKASPARLVRRWRVLNPTADAKARLTRAGLQSLIEGVAGLEWRPAYSTVAGDLPLSDVPPFLGFGDQFGLARFELEATSPGKIALRVNVPGGVRLWVGKEERPLSDKTELTLPQGKHVLTLVVDAPRRTAPLRLELFDVPGSTGRVNLVGGP